MTEYLIRRTDGEWFDLTPSQFPLALRPNSVSWEHVEGWGDYRIRAGGVDIAFSYEDPGIQVIFDGGVMERDAQIIVGEVLANIEKVTSQKGRIVPL